MWVGGVADQGEEGSRPAVTLTLTLTLMESYDSAERLNPIIPQKKEGPPERRCVKVVMNFQNAFQPTNPELKPRINQRFLKMLVRS